MSIYGRVVREALNHIHEGRDHFGVDVGGGKELYFVHLCVLTKLGNCGKRLFGMECCAHWGYPYLIVCKYGGIEPSYRKNHCLMDVIGKGYRVGTRFNRAEIPAFLEEKEQEK